MNREILRNMTMPMTPRQRRRMTVILAATGVMVLLCAWMMWVFYPVTAVERRASDTRVATQTRYLLMAGDKALLAFSGSRADTLLTGVVTADRGFVSDTVDAQWVKRWRMLPYSNGHFMTEPYDTLGVASMTADRLRRLLQDEADYLEYIKKVLREQRGDVDYYLKTHLVTDDGFDIVQRYSRALTRTTDSISRADSLVREALKAKTLSVKLDRRFQTVDSTKIRTFSRMGGKAALRRLEERRLARPKVAMSRIDSLGQYDGERDSLSLPNGYGRFLGHKGDFYEGEWSHGRRAGAGFSMVPGKRLRLGEWKDDAFLGERITHTPERIYGIDISRYQHEAGRKRFTIDWSNLRITSLGTFTKKKIKGTVDYPVRFVYIKATEGVTVKNKYFNADYVASRKSGYRTGAYHFMSLKTTGTDQARNFLRNARYHEGDMPPVLDIEPTDRQIKATGGIDVMFRNVRAWISAVEKQWGVKPILYVSQRFVNKYLSEAPDLKKDCDVWIARYSEYKPDVNLEFWQLCQDGRVRGIHGPVDINVYNGLEF